MTCPHSASDLMKFQAKMVGALVGSIQAAVSFPGSASR